MKQNLILKKRTEWGITCGLHKFTEILNLSSAPNGIYILKINDLIGNAISTKKVIILK